MIEAKVDHRTRDRCVCAAAEVATQQVYDNVETDENLLTPSREASVSSTELRLREIEDKAAPGVILWRLYDFDRFLGGPASGGVGRDRSEWTQRS
jgi:hypothetical protein